MLTRLTPKAWLNGQPLSPRAHVIWGLLLPAIVLAVQMSRVWSFTVDDAYISFRYARNLAEGYGLVYNPGEYVEGYTNFLWTLILALGIKLNIDPVLASKVMGAASAFGSLALTYRLSQRLMPLRSFPCVSTWLLSTSIVFSGYAIFGLETGGFLFLILLGCWLMLNETDVANRTHWPWSGLVFGLAALTRPEAPLFIGLLMLFLGRQFLGRQNIYRGLLFVSLVGAHLLFRVYYYGSWMPNTLSAKTGNLEYQLGNGLTYLMNYAEHTGPILWFALLGTVTAITLKQKQLIAIAVMAIAFSSYIALVGGDWMPLFRFMSPVEPLVFILMDAGLRSLLDRREQALNITLAIILGIAAWARLDTLQDSQDFIIDHEKHFWDTAAGGTAQWFLQNGKPGDIGIGDIGYIGYATRRPILDLLGLVDPNISRMRGGYTQKTGSEWLDYIFERAPRYLLIISSSHHCQQPSVYGSQLIYNDPRFAQRYQLAGKTRLDNGFAWCFYELTVTSGESRNTSSDTHPQASSPY
ncbi:MAG TPA: hypothetical protein VIM96_00675 [Pseudomonadales bacterium]